MELNGVFDLLIALPTYGERLSAMPVEAKRAEPEAALRYLDELDRRHGGAKAWLFAAGLSSADELDALSDQLAKPL
ncbi:hypothetical protein ABKW28_18230 [Nocardioides sp. 31GB23]|uniref:hypothetical protein n=1 Tax=Nocardioides sp. 31GB23 TaxID=3156065 RepID=UPI0032AF59B8